MSDRHRIEDRETHVDEESGPPVPDPAKTSHPAGEEHAADNRENESPG